MAVKYFLIIMCYLLPSIAIGQDFKPLFNKIYSMSEAGDGEAAYHLGMLYNNGIGTSVNIPKAYYWFKFSAGENDPLGAYKLGCYFAGQAGDVVEFDAEKAHYYKLISADAGYSYAQHDVALTYLRNGNKEKAIEYITKSARQGFKSAFEVLAMLNYQGIVIPKNLVKAHSFTLLSMMAGNGQSNQRALDFMKNIESELTQEEIQDSIELAGKWRIKKSPVTLNANSGLSRSYQIAELPLPSK